MCQRFNAAEDSGGVGRGCCLAQVGVSAISLLMMQRVWAGGADRTGGCVSDIAADDARGVGRGC